MPDLNETLAGMRKDAARGKDIAGAFLQHKWASNMTVHEWYRTDIAKLARDLESTLSAVQNMLALHKPETRYTAPGYDECSFDTAEEAREYSDDGDVYTFTVCAHCGRIEMGDDSGHDYRESTWPCATHKALTDALGSEGSEQ